MYLAYWNVGYLKQKVLEYQYSKFKGLVVQYICVWKIILNILKVYFDIQIRQEQNYEDETYAKNEE